MGANITPKAVTKAGKSIGTVQHVCQAFEKQTSSTKRSGHHPYPKFGKDFEMVLSVLEEEKVFQMIGNRHHDTIKLNCGLLEKLSIDKLIKKVQNNIHQIYFV